MAPDGVDPSAVRQLLLQHSYSPLVSVQSTHNADRLLQQQCNNPSLSTLVVLKPYGNNVRHGVPNQTFRVTNTQLITKNYRSFPLRFEPSLPELLTVHNHTDKLKSLFSISSLELLMKSQATETTKTDGNSSEDNSSDPSDDLYSSMFRKVVSSNRVVSFDTFNHPVAHLFVVDFAADTFDDVRRLLVEFRNYAFPKYFSISDVLVHVFILYDPAQDVAPLQAQLRKELQLSSTGIPIKSESSDSESDFVTLWENENATIDQEIQHLSLQQSETPSAKQMLQVPSSLDHVLRHKLYDFINRSLLPHMEQKIRTWDDSVLGPKKSITGRFFSVSRKLFNNSNDNVASNTQAGSYNHTGNYYHRSAPEQVIRKLADWSVMLNDFKYAYSTYDLIKKDYTNDKAWVYVASTQEMCIVSLLLAQTQPLTSDTLPQRPDKGTLRKIRHDIIEPYVDNLSYTFKSRFNVKTYAIRTYLVVAELLLNMSLVFNISWWWSDLIEEFFVKAENELKAHLSSASEGPSVTRAILFERIGFAKFHTNFVPSTHVQAIEHLLSDGVVVQTQPEVEEGCYRNSHKLMPQNDTAVKGLTRFRKSALWYILSMREWLQLANRGQTQKLLRQVGMCYNTAEITSEWYDRSDLILSRIKKEVLAP